MARQSKVRAAYVDPAGIVGWFPFTLGHMDWSSLPHVDPAPFGPLPALARAPLLNDAPADVVHVWPFEPVIERLWMGAVASLVEEQEPARDEADEDEIREWIAATRHLANRWPFASAHEGALRQLADRIEAVDSIRGCVQKRKWPTTATLRRQFRTGLWIWGVAELRAGLLAFPADVGRQYRVATLREMGEDVLGRRWPADLERHRPQMERALAEGSLEQRIHRLNARLIPDRRAACMALLLHDALSFGEPLLGHVALTADDPAHPFPFRPALRRNVNLRKN